MILKLLFESGCAQQIRRYPSLLRAEKKEQSTQHPLKRPLPFPQPIASDLDLFCAVLTLRP